MNMEHKFIIAHRRFMANAVVLAASVFVFAGAVFLVLHRVAAMVGIEIFFAFLLWLPPSLPSSYQALL